jgi:hypothetical protein
VLFEGQSFKEAQRGFLYDLAILLRHPLAVPIGAFAIWSGLSLIWSDQKSLTIFALMEFWWPVAMAFIAAIILLKRVPDKALLWLAGGILVAALIIIIDLKTHMQLRQMLGMRANSFVQNRPVVTLLVLLPAVMSALFAQHYKMMPLLMACGVAAAIFLSESGAARLGLAAMVLVYGAVYVLPRLSRLIFTGAILLLLALAPFLGEISARLIPPEMHQTLSESHSKARVDIWRSYGAAIREQPWLGAGFGVSTKLDQTPVAQQVAPEFQLLLAVGHPHNAFVQIWAELGLIGAALAATLWLGLMRSLRPLSVSFQALALSLMAAILAVALVGHGAWQGWWPASIGAALIIMNAYRKFHHEL